MRTKTVDAVRQDVDVRMIQEWGGMIYWINPTFSIRSKVRIHQQSHSLVPTKLVNSLLFFPLSTKMRSFSEKVPMKLLANFLQIGASLVTLFGLFSTCV